MNERIEKLAMQANSHHDNFFDLNYKELDSFLEKFAELIVKEAGKYLTSPEFIGRSDLDWDMVLKEHFGVK